MFGCVYYCWEEGTEKVLALKQVKKFKGMHKPRDQWEPLGEKEIKMNMDEIEAMNRMKNKPNWINLECFAQTDHYYYQVMEAANGGELHDVIEAQGGKLSEEATRLIVKQLVYGLWGLKGNNIIHRDFKPSNILIMYTEFEKENPGLLMRVARGDVETKEFKAQQENFYKTMNLEE